MTTAAEFKRFNDSWAVVNAAWTVNGRNIKKEPPERWNYMRVKMENGEEFLLSAETVKEIGSMRWKGIKSALILSILITTLLYNPSYVAAETDAQLAFNGLYHHMERR